MKSLKELKFDIIAIQETHLKNNESKIIESKWGGPCFFSEGTGNSRGLCLLFNKTFKNYTINVITSGERFLLCSLNIGGNEIYIGNVYAPAADKKIKIKFFII